MVLLWGGSPAAEPLTYGIGTDFLNNYNNPNNSSSSCGAIYDGYSDLSSNVNNSNIGSPSAVLTSILTSLDQDTDDLDSSISTERSGQRK